MAANVENNTILKVVTKMREIANYQHADVRNRITHLKAAMTSF